MNKIYTVMVITDLNYNSVTKCPEFGSSSLVGWYSQYYNARSSVE